MIIHSVWCATLAERITLFLIATNVLLGLLVLVCWVLVLRQILQELGIRRRMRSMTISSIGVTMADGGARRDGSTQLFVTRNGTIKKQQRSGKDTRQGSS